MKLNIDPDGVKTTSEFFNQPIYANPEEHDPEGSLCFRFTRKEVATNDASRFLALFARGNLSALSLRAMRGSLIIELPTTVARHAEPFLCDVTRRFCRTLYAAFPAWAFFFSLESLSLWKMSLALLDEARVIQFERAWQTRVIVPVTNLEKLVATHLDQARVMAWRAKMSDSETDQICGAVKGYFAKVAVSYSLM